MYQVLARKYRPADFSEVTGQAKVVKVLRSAIEDGKTGHAYLFCGPRGTGKTSMARILAKSLNCENGGPTTTPCLRCETCAAVAAGAMADVLEIDGASNRGIDEIRALRENVNLRPGRAPFKVYIIDEVHMLTTEAFNALLKTLEEPPEYVVFILATTAPEKVPLTILSRCQRLEFRPLAFDEIRGRLGDIAAREKVGIDDDALARIIEYAGGALRDCLGILDQLIVFCSGNRIRLADVASLLGLADAEAVEEMVGLLAAGRTVEAIGLLHRTLGGGKDPGVLLDEMIRKLRDVGFVRMGESGFAAPGPEFLARVERLGLDEILDALAVCLEYRERVRRDTLQVIVMEILLLKLGALLSGGTPGGEPAPARPAAAARPAPGPAAGAAARAPRAAPRSRPPEVAEPSAPRPEPPAPPPAADPPAPVAAPPPAPAPPEETPPPANAGDTAADWVRLLAAVKKEKRHVEACLKEGRLESVRGTTVTISFGAKHKFHKERVEQNMAILNKAVSAVFGNGYNVLLSFADREEKSPLDDEEVKKVIAFFDGEITDVKE